MSVNDFLDKLEQENFFNADVYILPFENGVSDGDSEDSDDDTEQCLSRPFAEHLTVQILKGDGSVTYVDDTGVHVIEEQSDEQLSLGKTSSSADSDNSVVTEKSTAQTKNKRKRLSLIQQSDKSEHFKASRSENIAHKELNKPATTAVLHESMPPMWNKLDITKQQSEKFS